MVINKHKFIYLVTQIFFGDMVWQIFFVTNIFLVIFLFHQEASVETIKLIF